jgi:hypothetical protein
VAVILLKSNSRLATNSENEKWRETSMTVRNCRGYKNG